MEPKNDLAEWENAPTNRASANGTVEVTLPSSDPALIVLVGSVAGKSYPLTGPLVIGRAPDADVRLPAPDVSRRHARVARTGPKEYTLEDLGSTNGTLVDGVPVQGSHPLRYGSRIQIGTQTVMMLTHRSPVEDQLIEQQKLEAVGRLAGGIVRAFAERLSEARARLAQLREESSRRTLGASEIVEALQEVEGAVARGLEISRQLDAYASIGPPAMARIDLASVLKDVMRIARNSGPKGVRFEFDIEPELWVIGDALQLQQALMTLCMAARDSTEGGGTVRLSASRFDVDADAGDWDMRPILGASSVVITLSDDRAELDPVVREQLFEPFAWCVPGKAFYPGLASVAAVVRAHSGHVEASGSGPGMTLRIFFPGADAAAQKASVAPTSTGIAAVPTSLTKR